MNAVIEDVFERHMQGNLAGRDRADVPPGLFLGLHPAPRPHRDGRLLGAGDRLLGHSGQGAQPPGLGPARRRINERIRSYTYLYPEPGEDAAEFWVEPRHDGRGRGALRAAGLHGGQVRPRRPLHHPRRPPARDVRHHPLRRLLRAIREAVGDKADLLFGTHGQFNTPGAIRLGRELEPYNPLWYEEPIPPDNAARIRRSRAAGPHSAGHGRAADDQGRIRHAAARSAA